MLYELIEIRKQITKEVIDMMNKFVPYVNDYIWPVIIEGNYKEHGYMKDSEAVTEVDVYCNKCLKYIGSKDIYYSPGMMGQIIHRIAYCESCKNIN